MPETGREEGTVRGRGGRRDRSEQAGSWKEPQEQSSVTPEMPPAASSTRRFNRSGNALKSQDSLGLVLEPDGVSARGTEQLTVCYMPCHGA